MAEKGSIWYFLSGRVTFFCFMLSQNYEVGLLYFILSRSQSGLIWELFTSNKRLVYLAVRARSASQCQGLLFLFSFFPFGHKQMKSSHRTLIMLSRFSLLPRFCWARAEKYLWMQPVVDLGLIFPSSVVWELLKLCTQLCRSMMDRIHQPTATQAIIRSKVPLSYSKRAWSQRHRLWKPGNKSVSHNPPVCV